MYTGPGAGSLLAAAAAWDGLAGELYSSAAGYASAVIRLAGESWLGPSSEAMTAAFTPFVSWLKTAAAVAATTAAQATAAAAAYEAAFAMTVPPSVVLDNRAQLVLLVATNFLGQNTAAIEATEAHYAEMWAQDAAAMYGYAISSAQAAQLPPVTPAPQPPNPAGSSAQAAAVGQDAVNAVGTVAQQASPQLNTALTGATPQAALAHAASVPAAAAALPAQEVVLPDVLGLNALAIAGSAASDIGIGISAGAWTSADESTQQILNEQDQLQVVQYDILHAIDLFSPLTPSRPDAYIPTPASSLSAAVGEAVSVGKLSVPINWAANAPEVRSLAYAAPMAGAGAAAAATAASAAAATTGGMGTAFSQMALAGMGGSALAGTVKPGRRDTVEVSSPQQQAKPAQEGPDQPVTGIAAEIREFAQLRDRGLITDEEYNEQKLRLLGR